MGTGKHPNATQEKVGFRQRLKHLERTVDFWRLLIAFLLAVLTCFLIHSQSSDSSYAARGEIRNVMIMVDNSNSDGSLYVLPQTFYVNLRITVDAFHFTTQYKPEQFVIRIDKKRLYKELCTRESNASTEPQEVEYKILDVDVVQKPRGVSLRDVEIGKIKVKCDLISKRDVPIHLHLDRRKENAGWTYECNLQRQTVQVRGPNHILARIASVSTEPIEITGTQRYSGMVALERIDDTSEVIMADSHVEYEVIPQKDSKGNATQSFNQLQVFFLVRENSQLEPITHPGEPQCRVDVRLHGPAKALKKINANDLRVVCDLTPFTMAGRQKVKLCVLNMPKDVQLEGIWPQDELSVELGYRQQPAAEMALPASVEH